MKEASFTWSLVIHWIQKTACSFRMFERSCLRQHRLFTFVRHYTSREVSCGMLTKVCKGRINYLNLLWFVHYPLTEWSHILTWCTQGGKVTFRNMLCTFKLKYYRPPTTPTTGMCAVVIPGPSLWLLSNKKLPQLITILTVWWQYLVCYYFHLYRWSSKPN